MYKYIELTVVLFRLCIRLCASIHRQPNRHDRLTSVQCNRVPMKQSHWPYSLVHLDRVAVAYVQFSLNKIDSLVCMYRPSTEHWHRRRTRKEKQNKFIDRYTSTIRPIEAVIAFIVDLSDRLHCLQRRHEM